MQVFSFSFHRIIYDLVRYLTLTDFHLIKFWALLSGCWLWEKSVKKVKGTGRGYKVGLILVTFPDSFCHLSTLSSRNY